MKPLLPQSPAALRFTESPGENDHCVCFVHCLAFNTTCLPLASVATTTGVPTTAASTTRVSAATTAVTTTAGVAAAVAATATTTIAARAAAVGTAAARATIGSVAAISAAVVVASLLHDRLAEIQWRTVGGVPPGIHPTS